MKQEMTHEIWDFIEENLPGYYHRDDVLRQSELQLLVDGHESSITGLSAEEAAGELNELILCLCMEAIHAHMQGKGKRIKTTKTHNRK